MLGNRPSDAITTKKGRIIDAAAPDANITARALRLTDLSDLRSIFRPRIGILDITSLMIGSFSLATGDLLTR